MTTVVAARRVHPCLSDGTGDEQRTCTAPGLVSLTTRELTGLVDFVFLFIYAFGYSKILSGALDGYFSYYLALFSRPCELVVSLLQTGSLYQHMSSKIWLNPYKRRNMHITMFSPEYDHPCVVFLCDC